MQGCSTMSHDAEWIRESETVDLERLAEEVRDELEDRSGLISESADETGTEEPAGSVHLYVLSVLDPEMPDRDFCRVKVGIAKEPMRRLEHLQTGNPYRLVLQGSVETPPSVARHVENWVHRTRAASLAQPEWLRLTRPEIPSLLEAIRQESARFAHIAHARAKWCQHESNGRERQPSDEERQLHKEVRDVYSQLCPATLRLRRTRARIELLTGLARCIPGVVEASILPAGRPRFAAQLVATKFHDLAKPYMLVAVHGVFRWRDVPTIGSSDWGDLRAHVERLEARVRDRDDSVFAGGLRDESARTDDLARLHTEWLELTQEEKRLKVDEEDVRARMIQRLEDFEAIAGICRYRRILKPKLDGKSFRAAYQREAAECCILLPATIRRRIYQCRAY
jgi:hypothetical protein